MDFARLDLLCVIPLGRQETHLFALFCVCYSDISLMKKKAVVLLSGGLDSTTILALAQSQNFDVYALSFDYSQKQSAELIAAQKIAQTAGVKQHSILKMDFGSLTHSALTTADIAVNDYSDNGEIPNTYVPARNTVFLSIALGWAESLEAHDIFIGVSAVDYSGYPDCRPEYIAAYQAMANLATKTGIEGKPIQIHTPLITLTKTQTIQLGLELGVDYGQTVTCYRLNKDGKACGACDSCQLRQKGFHQAGIADPTSYLA